MSPTKEWTLMFFFASDNPLAISIVSQLKALKAAGFHQDANVIAQFDPFTEGTPTHIFDVNLINKQKNPGKSQIGWAANDSFVRDLIEDKLWKSQKTRKKEPVRDALKHLFKTKYNFVYDPPLSPTNGVATRRPNGEREEPNPKDALERFLEFCRKEYPAKHYMLFILGHGVVVGNDIFLLDEHADEHSLTLAEMGRALRNFNRAVARQEKPGALELISFHSCSVSSLEVANELAGAANYMLASQGPAFVGSWPYRQILVRIFKDLQRNGRKINIRHLVTDIFYYCLYNSEDFLLAGYSYQLALCDLRRISDMKAPLEQLSKALVAGLKDPMGLDCILLAHLKAQSFFHETYTDLYDFCLCLHKRYEEIKEANGKLGVVSPKLQAIADACDPVMDKLAKPKLRRRPNGNGSSDWKLMIATEFAGPAYQYSHGMSIYFPWAPSGDSQILKQYGTYKINDGLETSWLDFLEAYFKETLREPVRVEKDRRRHPLKLTEEETLQEDLASLVYQQEGSLSNTNALGGSKSDPNDRTGGDCDCVSIKNYPVDIRGRGRRRKPKSRLWDESFCIRQDLRK